MPSKHPLRGAFRVEEAENTLDVGGCEQVLIFRLHHRISRDAVEEARWWKLLIVTNDDRLAAADDRSERLYRLHLARFIEHDDVELDASRRKVGGNRHRAHHENRLDCLNRSSGLRDDLPDG